MVRDLTDPEMGLCAKNKEAALKAKAKGNECFSKRDYPNALHFYSQVQKKFNFLYNLFETGENKGKRTNFGPSILLHGWFIQLT